MTALRIDGKAVSDQRRHSLSDDVAELRTQGIMPCLVAVGLGSDHGWEVYTRNQERACATVGIRYWRENIAADAGQDDLAALLEGLNTDPQVHGIIVQSPLPEGLDERAAQALLAPDKDVEAVNPANLGLVLQGRAVVAPCTARSAVALAEHHLGDLRGVDAVVVGASVIVGRPLAELLLSAGATVSVCHIDTQDLASYTRNADLLIVAVGKAGLITPDLVKPGATVIDVGINRINDSQGRSKTVGDVDPAVAEVAGALSPVPGGVGAMTTTILLEATVAAARRARHQPQAVGAAGMARMLGEAGAQLPPELLERLSRMLSAHVVGGAHAWSAGSPLARRLGHRLVVLDGAVGTELQAAGITTVPLAKANVEHPDSVLAVHRAYVEAGAGAITTNTFCCNRFTFAGDREAAIRCAQVGVRLARQAAAGRVPVLASLGPLGPSVLASHSLRHSTTDTIDEATARAAVSEVAHAMADAGADGFIIETMPSTREAVVQVEACRQVGDLPILVSRAMQRVDEDELRDFAHAMQEAGVAAIGVNCAGGPRRLLPVVQALATMTSLPVFALPNAGFPTRDGHGHLHYHLHSDYLLRYTQAYIDAGAALVGGCCGVGPEHIRAMAQRFAQSPLKRPTTARPKRSASTSVLRPDPFLQHLRSDQTTICAMVPGRLPVSVIEDSASRLAEHGCDAIGILAGWPGSGGNGGHLAARLRRVADTCQRPAILEIPAAAIDVAAAETALHAAHDLGVRHLLIDGGVFSSLVESPGRGVDPIHLLALIADGNRGYDLRGVRLDEPWSFTVGVRLPADALTSADAMEQAGADYISIQPIYDRQAYRQAMHDVAESACTIPIMAEILVLPDAETADELNYELPVLSVPQRLRDRLAENPDEDVAGVLRFLQHWRQRLSGVILLLPDERTAQAEAVLRGIRKEEARP
ncbi:MAG: hypothetical protein EA401_07055 [Planctomycetota bacterium]|nr:MAG: hypothetical protein EA401_07055 [Planctomycetota bacterium]